MKRIRFLYARSDKLKYISHLDMMRLWPRVFRRAGLALSYSEGFNAHPRLAVAAPLAVGWTGEAELMEVWLENPPPVPALLGMIRPQLPEGLIIEQGIAIPPDAPSLQSLVRFAEYQVSLAVNRSVSEMQQAVDNLLDLSSLDWSHQRDKETRRYDLRAQIDDVSFTGVRGDAACLFMRLKNDPSGSGRPEQVSLALGFSRPPLSIHRTRLVMA